MKWVDAHCSLSWGKQASQERSYVRDVGGVRNSDGSWPFPRVRSAGGTSTLRRRCTTLALTLVATFILIGASSSPARASDPCAGADQQLTAPQIAYPGLVLCSYEDNNQAYSLQFQGDCNLVLLTGRYQPLWSSNTGGRTCTNTNSCLAMQGDGNLVIYYPNGCGNQPALWVSGTGGHSAGNYCLAVQDDGNVVIYTPSSPCGFNASYLQGANSPTWTQSSDSRPIEGADSWRTSPVIEGRNTCAYPCKSTPVYFRAIDQYSSRQPTWTPWVQNAVNSWIQGPTIYSFSPHANDTWNYIDATYPGDTTYASCGSYLNIVPSAYGLTIFYDQFGNPSSGWQAMTIRWTDVCLNGNRLPSGGALVQGTTAHELGHTLGLAHNLRDHNSIMYPGTSGSGPDSNDIGAFPGCSRQANGYGGLGGGSNCIYGWGD